MMWIKHGLPHRSGYYLTVYESEGYKYYKAFWWNSEKEEWVFRFKPNVLAWWPRQYDYYVPCQYDQKDVIPYD